MKKTMSFLYLALLGSVLTFTQAKAQCDPWIVDAYKYLHGRTPSSAECNIKNYNNGSWGSYAQLLSLVYNYSKPLGMQGDPWIIQAYWEMYQKLPQPWELNVKNYNSGSWNSYDDLKKYIKEYKTNMSSAGITIVSGQNTKGNVLVGHLQNGNLVALSEVSKNKGEVIASGGGNVVAGGGGNLIGQAGGNLIGGAGANVINPSGNNVIATGGGNLNSLKGVSFIGQYTTLSAGSTAIKTSGKGRIAIQ